MIAVLVTRLQNRLSRESLDEVKEKAQSHIKTSDEIVELAGSLNQKFSSARAVSDKLKEAVVTSNNSVSEIAKQVQSLMLIRSNNRRIGRQIYKRA